MDHVNLSQRSVNVITLFAEDLARTKSFYQEVLGLPVAYEDENSAVFKFQNTVVNLTDVSTAPEFIGPAVVASPEAGSRFILAVFVDDVDAACTELTRHGVTLLNGPVDRPASGMRIATFSDPAGHTWEVAQDLQ
jgi:catechol 2,3-dioxygenase-like lactoylglutathione lyase family enzyme